jgi:hypothetical protein
MFVAPKSKKKSIVGSAPRDSDATQLPSRWHAMERAVHDYSREGAFALESLAFGATCVAGSTPITCDGFSWRSGRSVPRTPPHPANEHPTTEHPTTTSARPKLYVPLRERR